MYKKSRISSQTIKLKIFANLEFFKMLEWCNDKNMQ